MSKKFPLQTLLDLSHHKSEAAIQKLGQLNQQQQMEQKKLEKLLQFRHEYHARYQEISSRGMDHHAMMNFQEFLSRLDEAVGQQTKIMEQASRSVERGRVEVQETQLSMKSFDTLAQRHAAMVLQSETRVDRKIQDEQSRQFAARSTDLTGDNP